MKNCTCIMCEKYIGRIAFPFVAETEETVVPSKCTTSRRSGKHLQMIVEASRSKVET